MTNLRAAVYGMMIGIAITLGSLVLVSAIAQVKWQPVYVGEKK